MLYLSYFGTASPRYYDIRKQDLPGPWNSPKNVDLLPEDLEREVLAISVNNLQGIHMADKNLYRWLLRRTPIARIGYSIYVYDVTGDAAAHLCLAKIYFEREMRDAAKYELRKVLVAEPWNDEAQAMAHELSPGETKAP